jgi:cyclic pyranopterin phosphate synthase
VTVARPTRRSLPLASEVESRRATREALPPVPTSFVPERLVDTRGREVRYLRISVTDRCDMACVYCMPPGGEREHGLREELLSFEEIARLVRAARPLGVRRVRLTGGEPLVRRDVVQLVARIRDVGIEDLVMTTNASRLGPLASALAEAGLTGVNVSIDSLDPARFARITRGGSLPSVLAGLEAARAAGLTIKTNTVVVRGENDDELPDLVRWAWSIGATPRFIELMPLGEGARLGADRLVPATEIRARLGDLVRDEALRADPDRGPARYLPSVDGIHRVGLISAVTDEFCASCNRLRVTAVGELRACLASRRAISLRDVVRSGATDREVAWALTWALSEKARGHAFGDLSVAEHTHVGMSLIGG